MCFNQRGDISTQNCNSLKLVGKFTYQGSSVLSTEKEINTQLARARTAIGRLSVIWKLDLTNKTKHHFPSSSCVNTAIWTRTKSMEKKLDSNYSRMLRAILNKSVRQHPTKQQVCGHLPPITKTIQVRRNRYTGYCWKSKDELMRDALQWSPSHGRAEGRTTA